MKPDDADFLDVAAKALDRVSLLASSSQDIKARYAALTILTASTRFELRRLEEDTVARTLEVLNGLDASSLGLFEGGALAAAKEAVRAAAGRGEDRDAHTGCPRSKKWRQPHPSARHPVPCTFPSGMGWY